ncbi:MAG: hypothetical protein J7L38_08540 [Thermoproteales archaeon]|nr:hypothetical protein [Thermoproteales archaeon]
MQIAVEIHDRGECSFDEKACIRIVETVVTWLTGMGFGQPSALKIIFASDHPARLARRHLVKGKSIGDFCFIAKDILFVRCSRMFNISVENLIKALTLYFQVYNTGQMNVEVAEEIARKMFFKVILLSTKV